MTHEGNDFQTFMEQPLSPRIPDSQQLQAQLLASFPPQHAPGQWSGILSPDNVTQSNSLQHHPARQDNKSHQQSVSKPCPSGQESNNVFITNLTINNEKSNPRTEKGRMKTPKKSQKIKQILSERVAVTADKNKLVKIAPKESAQKGTLNKMSSLSTQNKLSKLNAQSSEEKQVVKSLNILPATASSASNVMGLSLGSHLSGNGVLANDTSTSNSFLSDLGNKTPRETQVGPLHTMLSQNSVIQLDSCTTNTLPVLNQIVPLGMIHTRPARDNSNVLNSGQEQFLGIGSTQALSITTPSSDENTHNEQLSQTRYVPSTLTSTGGLSNVTGQKSTLPVNEQFMAHIIPLTMLQTIPSITTATPVTVNLGTTLGNSIPSTHSVQSGTLLSPAQPVNNMAQLSPGSLSVMALVNQLINSESLQLGKQKENSILQKSPVPSNEHLVEVSETVLPRQFDDSVSSNNLKQTVNVPLENCDLNRQEENTSNLSEEDKHKKTGTSENVMMTYQHLQNVIGSLINGLQGQLDATRKLYSPTSILATGAPQPNAAIQIGEQSLDMGSSNQLADIAFPLVHLPINTQNVQVSNSQMANPSHCIETVRNQQLSVENGNISQGEITNLNHHQTIGNQLGVDTTLSEEHTISSGDQLIGHGERLMDDSFLSEQSESLYDEPFLYNKNIEQYVNSRGDNSVILQNEMPVDQAQVQENGCEDVTDSNGLKNQLLLSADPEEDFTDVPSMFKHYCILCKAAMLNDECQFHKIGYNLIKDTPILSKARTSIPTCLTLQPTSTFEYNAYLGVWTKESIPSQTKFGPLVGLVQKESGNTSNTVPSFPTWKIFLETRSETIDMSDENECNWMMFLKPARCEKTQNLIAHQLGRHIYFFTTKEVFCGQELLYWFSKEYATLSGYPSQPGDASLSECPNCGKMFVDKTVRKLHMKDHPHNQKFKCHICDHSYSSLSSLKRHTMLHMGVKPHICHVCHKTFSDGSNLRVHLKVHTGMKIFKCHLCEKTFRQKAHLKMHLLVHTGQKNLKCYFCDKTFAREGDRKQHEYQHTKEKSYKCDECDKIFYKLQNYKRHLITHTGVRDFQCQFCMKTFGRKFHLKRHTDKCQARNEIFEEKDLILNNADLKRILNS